MITLNKLKRIFVLSVALIVLLFSSCSYEPPIEPTANNALTSGSSTNQTGGSTEESTGNSENSTGTTEESTGNTGASTGNSESSTDNTAESADDSGNSTGDTENSTTTARPRGNYVVQPTTKSDVSTQYIYVQTLNGEGYEKVNILANTIPAGTKLSELDSIYGISVYGCTVTGMIEQELTDGRRVLSIYFDRNTITYSFYADDQLVASFTGLYGNSFTLPPYQKKDGHLFVRWIDSEGNSAPSIFETESDSDFYAEWQAASRTYGKKSRPDAIGDIVFSDGSATAYDDPEIYELLPEQRDSIISVIFYIGQKCSTDSSSRTLGISLNSSSTELAWCSSDAQAAGKFISEIECHPTSSFIQFFSDSEFWYNVNGTENFQKLQNAVSDATNSSRYPSWNWINRFTESSSLPDEWKTGWYMPTIAELAMLYCSKDTVNSALNVIGGTLLQDRFYISSSQVSNWSDLINSKKLAWGIWFTDGEVKAVNKTNSGYVCAIHEF